jgi:phosphoserine phosphatase
MARRYSAPIEALARQSDRIGQGQLEAGRPIQTHITELRQLAEAQDRLRNALGSLLKVEEDLLIARQIQQGTFPSELPGVPGYQLDGWSEPADATGGDTYDLVACEALGEGGLTLADGDTSRRLVLLLADATGHGIGPALSVTQMRAMLRMALRLGGELSPILAHLNRQLCQDLGGGRFITAWFGDLDARTHELRAIAAGQGPILHYRARADALDVAPADAMPLGILEDTELTPPPPRKLEKGDVVLIASDGIYEARNPTGELFGVDRVAEVLRRHRRDGATTLLHALQEAVRAFCADRPADDDRTAVVLSRER